MVGEPVSDPARREARPPRSRRDQARLGVALALGALAALFAVLNLDEVQVNWIVATSDTPLIIVIAVCVLIGSGLGWIARGRR